MPRRQRLLDCSVIGLAGVPLGEEELATIFEPYRRAAAALTGGHKGWGLGLTIVRWIAEAHGGLVKAESGEGKGTTFRVVLPMDSRPAGSAGR